MAARCVERAGGVLLVASDGASGIAAGRSLRAMQCCRAPDWGYAAFMQPEGRREKGVGGTDLTAA